MADVSIDYKNVSKIPDRPALAAFLFDYYQNVLPKLAAVGGPEISAADIMRGVWDDIDLYLPPKGAVTLAFREGGLVGCGFLKRLTDSSGELKRLCVAPDCRGQGVGKNLITKRIAAARDLGLTTLYADTVRGNRPMLSLYEQLGFEYIDRYDGNANPPEWTPWLVYLRLDLP